MSPRLPRAWQGPAPLHSPSGEAAMGFFINLTELAGKNKDIFWHSLDHKRSSRLLAPELRAAWGCLHPAACMVQACLEVSSAPQKPKGSFYPWCAFSAKIICCFHLTRDTARAHKFSDILLKKRFSSKISRTTHCW